MVQRMIELLTFGLYNKIASRSTSEELYNEKRNRIMDSGNCIVSQCVLRHKAGNNGD
jgi:hypothetical protein